jgi:pimeloyl-ACP methyl ester carboxylesterase
MSELEQITYDDFGGSGRLIHFAHANGYPPGAYRPLIDQLVKSFHVLAIHMRPLWPNSSPGAIKDWSIFSVDLDLFLDQIDEQTVIGIGHSMGATISLNLALQQPDRFQALILIDPVIFDPNKIRLWSLLSAMHLDELLTYFDDLQAVIDNYRQKPVFRRINTENLILMAEAATTQLDDGGRSLWYPPAWEALIYKTSLTAVMQIWSSLKPLQIPILILYGSESKTFTSTSARLIQKRMPHIELHPFPDSSHLLPLERPDQVAAKILEFLSRNQLGKGA